MLKLKRDHIPTAQWCSASKEELQAAVQCLRNNFITYVGPFVIKSGVAVFKVSDYLLTVDELVSLHKSGRLTRDGLERFAGDLDTAEGRMGLQRKG